MIRSLAAAASVSVVAFVIYAITLAPSVHVGDSAELAGAAATLGIAHPPGYPLWTILGRTAVVLGPASAAAATNLLSAVSLALATGLVAATLIRLTGRVLVSAGAALAFALSRGVWGTAVVTEVYALNLLFTIAVLYAAVSARRGRPALFLLAAYLLGLGAANHPFVLLTGPLLAVLALFPSEHLPEPPTRRTARLLPMAGLFALGLSAYLYLPIRLAAGPEWVWGGLRGAGDLLDHVLRAQYGGLGESSADASVFVRWRIFAGIVARSVPWLLGAIGLFGLGALARGGHPKRAALLLAFFLLAGPVTAAGIRYEDTFLDRSVASVFFLPAVLAAYLIAGVGLAEIDRTVRRRLSGQGAAGLLFTVAIALFVPAAVGRASYPTCDRRGATLPAAYADEVFRELPDGALLYAKGDNEVFILSYYHRIEGKRPDVDVVDWTMNLDVAAWGEEMVARPRPERPAARRPRALEMIFADRERPVFITDLIDMTGFGGCRIAPNGFLFQLLRPGEVGLGLPFHMFPVPAADPDDFLETHLAATILFRQGQTLVRMGQEDAGRKCLLAAASRCGENPVVLRNIALAHRDLGDPTRAEELLNRTLEYDPGNGDALFDLGTLLSSQGRPLEAVAVFDRLLAAGFDLPEVHLSRGIQLVQAGNLEEAARSAARAVELAPGLESAHRLATAVARGIEIGGEAGLLEAHRGLGMVTLEGTLQLAMRYLEKGDVARATELFREASQSDPEDPGAAYGLGYGLLRAGHWTEAGDVFRRILEVQPESADGRNALAYVLSQIGDSLDVAERLAEEAIEIDPPRSGYWYDTLGWVQFRRGKEKDALEALLESKRRLPPDDISMLAENGYHLGAVLLSLGRPEEAKPHIEFSLSLADDEMWVADLRAKARKIGLDGGDS